LLTGGVPPTPLRFGDYVTPSHLLSQKKAKKRGASKKRVR